MRILLINSDIGYGSTGRITSDLYHSIIASENEAGIGYGRECTEDLTGNIRIGNQLDVYIHALKTRLFDLQGFGSVKATRKFIQQIKVYRPDLIHLHNIHGSYINIKLLFEYIKEMGIPVIWTLHDCWAYTGHCAHYTFVNCNRWKTGCHNCIQKTLYPASYLFDNSKKNYSLKKEIFTGVENLTIVTVSNWLKDEVKNSFLRDYEVRVISNGIDLNIFKPSISSFRQNNHLENITILLGVASIWSDRKGLGLFNDLAEKLDNNYKIVLVGMEKKQRKLLSGNILAVSRTNQLTELAEIYSAADIFLNPSMEETFGMVSLEALACGTQVITNKYSANPELVNEKCGMIVEDINAESYMTAIRELKKMPKDANDCVQWAKQFNKNKCYQAYLDLYKEVIP
ncbi:glycosyltransferase family 4 protein [Anaerocolumna aminovalerica]|jgi:putative colanic acid biosynthesis glycosyltransferase|uniref:Glycosyltransferase involved in cell wall bisynthesis n=1 Tax=Anaerocolumna aminovalerica TaxID=1527 RepID=A0A1I5G3F6_9FIRM|nr:glycosyltransferase [Anaerocolumna aminovalerica]MBU5331254.1 glycosyltransferase [Anaerocolumna aminovalerica]MDU6264262.1 glycosyltransferase [Anaerocolumna aminovalerica]SFO30557.1 Glycosyltransferase involved in cell wall bisynthesis [Anaerocolumna aminovalerica]